jgi:MOSC domain-containing protein
MPVSEPMLAQVQAIFRYPVKGLTPEPLPSTDLAVGETIPGDRLYAIENGPSGFDPVAPRHQPKARYLMLMRNERLATLSARLEPVDHVLTIEHGGRAAVRANLKSAEGRAAVEAFFAAFCADDLRGPPKILYAPGHSFSDVASKVVSIINLASVAALENAVGAPVHPLRFRGNVYVSGWPAWHEFTLLGREIAIGKDARLKVVKRIVRCAATNVDPDTGMRDLAVPETLERAFGHGDCGVYAEVVGAGRIAAGDAVRG